jgi:hypothetical protein
MLKVDYSYKPKMEDVVVGLYNHSQSEYYSNLVTSLHETSIHYGIQTVEGTKAYQVKQYNDCLIKHAIVLTDIEDVVEASEKYAKLLDWYQTMSLGMTSFKSYDEMVRWRDTIEKLKQHYNHRINYLRPDLFLADGRCLISQQKILDNAVCDTVRVKYNPKLIDDQAVLLDKKYQDFFTAISKLYTDYHLYHRSPSDGFFAVRKGEDFYITATKTHKSPLDLRRLALVHDYQEKDNELSYSGVYLPSSDVVEATYVFKENPEITAIIHTHASDHYTRNEDFSDKIKVGPASYGVPELGKEINKVIKSHLDDFIILQEHGEVFAFTGDLIDIPQKMEQVLLSTIPQTV